MERWASVHISTSVLEQREKSIPSLSSSLNEQLQGADITAQSPSSKPAVAGPQEAAPRASTHFEGLRLPGQGWLCRAASTAPWNTSPGLLPCTHGIPRTRHTKTWKQLANSTYFIQGDPSPGGCCTPWSPWRGAGQELLPGSAHSSPSPTLSKTGALPLGCLIWLPLQKAQKEQFGWF